MDEKAKEAAREPLCAELNYGESNIKLNGSNVLVSE